MLKRIPKSDISIRPFKAYKEWSFDNNSTEIDLLQAREYPLFDYSDITSGSNLEFYKHSIYGQLRAQFYNGNEDNPFMRFGTKTNVYDNEDSTKERYLSGSAKVISIPQKYFGEGIKKSSVTITDGTSSYTDDSNGNLIIGGDKIGNVFYSQGLITITRDSDSKLLSGWNLNYKSTQTIYENEYLLIVEPDEFNISTNPSAVVKVGEEVSTTTDSFGVVRRVVTNPGVRYIRKLSTLDNGNVLDYRYTSSVNPTIKAGFEEYEVSSSFDSTGSYLTPFITTIGLYDDNCDLMAVAKVPQPIKSYPDLPVNFIVRFDT